MDSTSPGHDADAATSGHLRSVLLSLGVGGPGMSQRALAKASGGLLSKDTWYRMTKPIPPGEIGHNWGQDILKAAADTLRKKGVAVTWQQLDWAMMRDRGHVPGFAGDDVVAQVRSLLYSLSHDDLIRLNQELALLLAAARRTDPSPQATTPVRVEPSMRG